MIIHKRSAADLTASIEDLDESISREFDPSEVISLLQEKIRLLEELWQVRMDEEHPGVDNVRLLRRR